MGSTKSTSPVAIVGVAVRLPKSDTLDEFWGHLAAGRSLISQVPARRWNAAALYGNPNSGHKTNSIWGGFLEDADAFDADFFQVSPREASWMDPQQRFALEMAWSALEDAGYRASALAGSRTGVYMGVCHWDYAELLEKNLAHVDAYLPTGIAFSVIANRVSHFFDFRGPSITNDTACAASLVSVYEAVRALQNGECDQALAGGVNLIWSPNHFVAFSKSGMLSRDGRSKAFDARADGYVRGEGGAMLLLKPLEAAERDGDPIYAVIRGIGTNHGGRTSSLTVTNPKAQAALIADVYREAGVSADAVSYIEAHGPGTPLGDPIEIAGLKEAFRGAAGGRCAIGSVKTNVGHLEGAAGVTGMVKVLAAMRYGALPPNVDFQSLNPVIDLAGTPFEIQATLKPWPMPRIAGVSSFGFGGTNAHVLLEGYAANLSGSTAARVMVPLSAKAPARLRAYAERLARFLETTAVSLPDLAFTLQTGREPMPARVAFVVTTRDELLGQLRAYAGGAAVTAEDELATRWASGEGVAWPAIPGARRIHAPSYPFDRKRFWMDESLGAKDADAVLHPLLQRNVSELEGQRFRSQWRGGEFFWADHRVNGTQVLPGVAVFEMLRAARGSTTLQVSNVVWTRPVTASSPEVELRLRQAANGEIGFELQNGGVAHVQGTVSEQPGVGATLDVAALQTQAQAMNVAECYERLQSSGLQLGPDYRGIAALYRGNGFVLAKLRLARHLYVTLESCPLHPILLDSAVQAWISLDTENHTAPGVPFACKTFTSHGPMEASMWAYVRRHGDSAMRFDIDICTAKGEVRASFRDLSLRIKAESTAATVFGSGEWVEAAGGPTGSLAEVLTLPRANGRADVVARQWFGLVHGRIQDWLRAGLKERRSLLVVTPGDTPRYLTAPLAALLKTAAMENPKLTGSVVRTDGSFDDERRFAGGGREVRIMADGRRLEWRAVEIPAPAPKPLQFDSDGVYWITGGHGGLGLHFAERLAKLGAKRIVLSNRSKANRAILGATVYDAPCDVSNAEDVQRVVAWIQSNVGPLRGVVHAAGVLRDGYLLSKPSTDVDAVFAPKVSGAWNLIEATRHLPLQFRLFCSSIAGVFGNAGQADYAAANAFLNALAEESQLATAVAWPLWADGGMQVDMASREALRRRFGTLALPLDEGLAAFERFLSADRALYSIYYGDRQRITDLLTPPPATAPVPAAIGPGGAELLEKTLHHLKTLLSESIRRDASEIRSNRKLEEYGLDSIVIVEMTNRLEEALGPLSKTLFFEHVDLDGVAGALLEDHRDALATLLGAAPAAPPVEAVPSVTLAPPEPVDERHDVAIVGMSLRVAKAADQTAFWEMLSRGIHGFEPYPESRWNHAALLHPERDVPGKSVVKTGAFLDDMDCFDPRYFRISQREAELMSPEVRLFLEASVEAFEDAGYSRETLQQRYGGDVAVITGSMTNEYDYYGFQNMLVRGTAASGSYTGTLPNMVSYFYGFTGPSYFLDTMCSGAATCVHEAVHMLRSGRTRMALAGGVNLLLHPHKLIAASQEHFTTKTAEVIRGYGLGADGTILGEGVGALVLKTLADAERDGDHIYAVIRGTAVSNAGVRNGFTVPNPKQQAAAIEAAIADAGVDPRTITYVEGHGSGTELGDPIEIKALTQAYRKHTADSQFCAIGTVKSNVAHLLGAAALPGIVKVALQMRHGQLAPSLHAQTLNPKIPFESTPFYVQRELSAWPRLRDASGQELPRRAGLTSIGAGGMNAHLILEEYCSGPRVVAAAGPNLFVFSAMTATTLPVVVERFCSYLTDQPLADVAYTLQIGKNELPCRLAVVATSRAELLTALRQFLRGETAGPWRYTRNILDSDVKASAAEISQAIQQRRLDTLATLWTQGVAISWGLLHQDRAPMRVSLPAYPFERVRCWYPEFADAPSVVDPLGSRWKLHPLVGRNESDAHGLRYSTAMHWGELLDYTFTQGQAIHLLPTAVLEALGAVARIAGLPEPGSIVLRAPVSNGVTSLLYRVDGQRITMEADGRLVAEAQVTAGQSSGAANVNLEEFRRGAQMLDREAIYAKLGAGGFQFQPYLQVVETAWLRGDGAVLCHVPMDARQQNHYKRGTLLRAPLLGAAWQALLLVSADAEITDAASMSVDGADATYVLFDGASLQFLYDAGRVQAAVEGVQLAGAVKVELPKATTNDDAVDAVIREIAASILKFAPEQLDMRASLYEYGFDSISLTRFATAINERFGSAITPATFFACENLAALRQYVGGAPAVRPSPVATKRAADGVAIVGMSARLPGSASADEFFDHLLQAQDLVGTFPYERYTGAYRKRLESAAFPKFGGFLTDIDRFDAAFFKVSPAEAERMDPQHRLLLESAWNAIADAGYHPDELPKDLGVFVGITGHDYASLLQAHGVEQDGYAATGNSLAMAANRISHFLNVHGPSQSVDTACSSSLVALLRAAEAIRAGQCRAALVGGVNLTLSAEGFEGPHRAGMLSPDGRSRPFSKVANGYVRGEGVVVLVVKRLADAESDGDRILGVLIGGSENHGGRAGSLTAPNPNAQAELVLRAMQGIDPQSIGYMEAHGTGTNLGDPVEMNGLRLAYSRLCGGMARTPWIGLGSVKSNIGHLEAAAGLAGVVKVLLAMRAGELPPTLHCDEVNPYVDLQDCPFYLVRSRQKWERHGEYPRRAGVSSFGFGGTNAHVVLEEYPAVGAARRQRLPKRVFAGPRYWIPSAKPVTQQQAMLWAPRWREQPISAGAKRAKRVILACSVSLPPIAGARVVDCSGTYEEAASRLLSLLQECLVETNLLLQVVTPLDSVYGGLAAMLETFRLENPACAVQLVSTDDVSQIVAETGEERVRYRHGRRFVRTWEELSPKAGDWPPGASILITGGTGALGRLIAADLTRNVPGMRLVLTGQAERHEHRLDCGDGEAVRRFVRAQGPFHAVIHCAGIHRDSGIARKSDAELRAVLRPKVDGTAALLEVCEELGVERLVLFSSLGGAFGNAGQVDYAAANGYMDALASLHTGPTKVVSIGWPYWREGGMSVDARGERALLERMGQRPLEAEAGLAALRAAVGSGERYVAVVAGDEERIRAFFGRSEDSSLEDATVENLRGVFGRLTGTPPRQIEADEPLDRYGIDSLLITQLNRELSGVTGDLPKTLFFEHRTLRAVAERMVQDHAEACRAWTGAKSGAPKAAPVVLGETPRVVQNEAIAIIGISGRYAGAEDLEEFWRALVEGRDLVREIPPERWDLKGFFEEDPGLAVESGKSYSKWGGFIEGFADFDPLFFRLAPRDAAAMDPQERLFLLACWHACEDAGYTRARLGSSVGVFAGITKTGYALHGPFRTPTGGMVRPTTSFSSAANRVSHLFNFSGPSMPVDTMCSSSLAAIHEACRHLLAGECEVALAGGVNLYLHPSNYVELCASRMLSPDGRCRSFGAGANGFVPGEGVGCVVLKPLSKAVADGDRIHAVIRGSAVNHGGQTNGYTVPNPAAQRDVIRLSLERAGLSADAVTYVEAHGTGTELGDPIEIAGLAQAFGRGGQCAIGSVKSNMGHAEAAAGIAGLTKVLLQMRHQIIVPTLHADELNPNLKLAGTPFTLQRCLAEWRPSASTGTRIAGVSSFGAGGSNAHIIVEEWPTRATTHDGRRVPILLSAKDPDALRRMAERLLRFLDAPGCIDFAEIVKEELAAILGVPATELDTDEGFESYQVGLAERVELRHALENRLQVSLPAGVFLDLASISEVVQELRRDVTAPPSTEALQDIAYTLLVGREPMEERLALEASTVAELVEGLQSWLDGKNQQTYAGRAGEHREVFRLLAADASFQTTMRRWAEDGQASKLLELWAKGLDVDWTPLARGLCGDAGIVSLPGYPFRGERYWISQVPVSNSLADQQQVLEKRIAQVLRGQLEGIRVAPEYERWLNAAKQLLAAYPEVAGDGWVEWATLEREPALQAQTALAEATLRALPAILSGKRKATEVMFPGGKAQLVEEVYTRNPVAARFNQALAQAALREVEQRLAQGPIRVLEIGAGTGSATDAVLMALALHRKAIAEYRFSDVSRSFLIRAERKYAESYPFLSTAVFDVEKPPAAQGIEVDAYDLVIASNVLHATCDIRQTLAHVRSVMKPGGALLLNETSAATLFTHVTFGFLEGWWRFRDGELRIAGTPSLSAASWQRAMQESGFVWVSGSTAEELALGQQILCATRAGSAAAALPLRDTLLRLVGETLNVSPGAIDVRRPFADYGLDSILGIELTHKLRRELQVELDVTRLFDFTTVAQLEQFLAKSVTRVEEPSVAPPEPSGREPIAIIGMSGRFAKSDNVDQLWGHLVQGHDLVEPVTRFSLQPHYQNAAPGTYCTHGSFLDGVDRFDPVFFGISGLEATYMDPQQRLFLEEAWKALEDAGHAGAEMTGRRCGVFVGCSAGDYQELFQGTPPGQAFWGNTSSLVPARIAYYLDLKGPAIAVDTACSSSLVAVHLACQSLWSGESEMAIAGGVFVQCTPRFYLYANRASMLSPTGRCAAFGESADGIVPGEAVAAVVLRPLRQALADGDHVLGVIAASGVNQDGTTNGITAPSAASQERLIRQLYEEAGIDPASVTLFEAHGTGTVLGDPIEHAALARAYASDGKTGFCALGSIKSNLGHATTAAGVVGLIKILLAMRHQQIPPTLHVGKGNPAIDLRTSPFYLPTEAREWAGERRRGAISSFGFSGTNAHVVVEEAPQQLGVRRSAGPALIVLSARTAGQLRQCAERLQRHLTSDTDLGAVAFTLLAGRRHMHHRLAVVATDAADLAQRLRQWLQGDVACAVATAELNDKDLRTEESQVRAAEQLARLGADAAALAEWGRFYLAGIVPPADKLFAPEERRRIPLPTYPFAQDRYWVKEEVTQAVTPVRIPGQKVQLAPLAPVVSRKADADGVLRLTGSEAASNLDDARCVLVEGASSIVAESCVLPVVGSGAGCDFVVADAAKAQAMAKRIAEAPRVSIVELKKHMIRGAQRPVGALLTIPDGPARAWTGSSRRMALGVDEVTAELFDDGVLLVTMRDVRGKNTFTDALTRGLHNALAEVARSADCKAVVLTGTDSYFACGGTKDGLEVLQRGEAKFTDFQPYLLPLRCEVPVIAAMQGHAVGAGWCMGMFSDLPVFSAESVYHSNYMWFGFTPGAGATLVFPHRFGDALGREILFTAWEYKGRELGARGIAMPVLTQAEVLPFALAAAHRFCASASREQLVEMKSRLAAPLRDELPVVLERELDMHQRTFVGNARVLERIKEAFQAEPEVATPVKVQSPPAAELRSALVATLAEELMIPAAEIRDGSGFLELGLDSILAVTWIRRINALFGVELPATAVYAHPTVGALVQHVAQLQPSVETPVAPAAAPPPPVRRSAIAIIGASARFPQAADLAEFWRNIRDGRDCISEVPGDRWNIQEHYDPDPQAPDMSYSKWMGSIDGIDRFDAAFFNITAMEAELMDPQQRLFLQHAWHAIEDAGINPTKLAGSQCGIFTAAGDSGYSELISDRNAYSLIGRSGSILAARLAYHLDLRGPSLSIDTACSSSLVAVAQACSSLLAGDTDLAIAGGVSVLLGPEMHIDTSKVSMLSKDGRCYSFDARANGFVPGEGIGVVVLKRLEDAERDGDPIRSVICGWGLNQDGRTNGITAPNPEAQTRLMRSVYQRFAIDPKSIGLVEAHGTGTPLGDPIEIEGLAGAFGNGPAWCAVGSVKSNIGHTLAAAGVAGLLKAMLAIEHCELPPTIHFEEANPHLPLRGTPFRINDRLRPWSSNDRRRAAVSSFGFSGTNAHVVLEEYVGAAVSPKPSGDLILALSARNAEQLRESIGRVEAFVVEHPDVDLAALAWTLQAGRAEFAQRKAFRFRTRGELLEQLRTGESKAGLHTAVERWVQGESIDWRQFYTGDPKVSRRIAVPGYPFAEVRHWVRQQRRQEAETRMHRWIDRNASTADQLRFTRKVRRSETGLHLHGDLTPGWFYPEMAQGAMELALGRRVRGLRNLLWGAPVCLNREGRELALEIVRDGDECLYQIAADGDELSPCQIGEVILDGNDMRPDDLDVAREQRLLQGRNEYRNGSVTLLHWKRSQAEESPLDAVWKWVADSHSGDPRFPYALRSVVYFDALPDECYVRITAPEPANLVAYGADGRPRLAMTGLTTARPHELAAISLDEEVAR